MDDTRGSSTPRATVVVPVRNGRRVLALQLEALDHQTMADDLEIVVVDDASADDTADVADRWCSAHPARDVRIVRRSHRGGPNASRNDGIRIASAPFVLLCDGDDVVTPDWAERLLAELERSPGRRLLVTGRCVALDDRDRPTDITLHGRVTSGGLPYMLGGNGGFPRRLALDIGGFDEQILAGGTEVDFSLRAIDAGASLVYVDDAIVGYRIPTSVRGLAARELRRSRGHVYLGRRHGSRTGLWTAGEVLVVPWRLAIATAVRTILRRPTEMDLGTAIGRAVGMTFWGVVFRLHAPPPIHGLADLTIAPDLPPG